MLFSFWQWIRKEVIPLWDTDIKKSRTNIYSLGYADDTVAFADSQRKSRIQLKYLTYNLVSKNRKIIQTFSGRHDKRSSTYQKRSHSITWQVRSHTFQPTNFNPDRIEIHQFITESSHILESSLAPWQELDPLKSFFFPSRYVMRTTQYGKEDRGRIDTMLKPLTKEVLNLPSHVTVSNIQWGTDNGLIGIRFAAWESDVAKLDTVFKLPTSNDIE